METEVKKEKHSGSKKVLFIAECLAVLGLLIGAVCGIAGGKRDRTPPIIRGVQDITVYQGDSVSYRKGITAQDDQDPAPKLEVDTTQVDLSVPATYTVTYIATDAAGNETTQAAMITVLPKGESFVELAVIEEAVDTFLADLLEDGMTVREQVEAIYHWANSGNIAYIGHSDRADYRQTAYTVLQDRQGDCYGYFAITKMMFERLGIPNIDVQKVRNFADDSDHFWSLVSVDGGKTYYHFDATPRIGDGDNFCLVTDEFLDAYSKEHDNCHNRDTSLYPRTP